MGFNLKSILPYLAGAAGSGISSQFSALAPFSAAIGAGAGALTNQKNPLGGALQGFAGGGVGSTLAGGVKGLFTGQPGSSGLDNFGSGAMSGLQSFGSSIPGFGGVGTSNPTGALAKFFSGSGGGLSDNGMSGSTGISNSDASKMTFGAGDGGYSNTSSQIKPPTFASPYTASGGASSLAAPVIGNTAGSSTGNVAGSMNPLGMFKSMIPGLAVAGAGSLLVPTPQAPDYSGVKADLMAKADAANVANQPAMTQYLSTLNAPTGDSAEAGVANAKLINDRQKAQAQKDLMDQFSANNGSTTGNSAYNDALTKSNAAYDQNYSAQAAQLQFEYDNQQQQQKMAAASALSGMNDQQLQFYAGLSNLDVQTIQDKFQLDAGRAQGLKDIATQAGALMMEKGLGLNGGVK